MPKENVNCALTEFRVEVGWEAGKDVQIGTTNAHRPFVDVHGTVNGLRFLGPDEKYDGYTMTGWFATLDRVAINRLIRVLRKARDAAFGADA